MPNDILEARVNQADEHQKDTSANLEALIQQNDENNPNPNLEVLINQNDDNNNKVVDKLDELKPKKEDSLPTKQLMTFLSGFFEQMRGDKGDKGDKGEQGVIGKTGKQGEKGIKGDTGTQGIKGEAGTQGEKGNNGKDGENSEVDINDLVKKTLERISKPKDGKDAKIDINDIVNKVVSKIKSLKDDNRVSYNNLKDVPQIYRKDTALGGMSNTTIANDLGLNFVDDEIPSGTLNGTNKDFTIKETPINGSLKVYRDGQRLKITEDYTLSGKTISLIFAPVSDQILLVDYRY